MYTKFDEEETTQLFVILQIFSALHTIRDIEFEKDGKAVEVARKATKALLDLKESVITDDLPF